MTVVLQQPKTNVVSTEGAVTVVGASPQHIISTELSGGVTVVSPAKAVQVIALEPKATVVPVQNTISVIAASEQTGPKVFFSSTPPFGAKLNDIWIKTQD